MDKKKCIAMVPCPGLGHLIPLVEFAKLLVHQHHNFQVTLLIPTIGPPTPSTKAILNTLPPNIDFTILPPINLQDLPQHIHIATQMKLTVKHSLPSIQESLTTLSSHTNLVAFICDLFSSDALVIAKQLNLLTYFFSTSGAISLPFGLSLPELDKSLTSEFIIDSIKTVSFPGCNVPFHVKDLPDLVSFGRSSETYKIFLRTCEEISLVDGVIINTFMDFEGEAIIAMEGNYREMDTLKVNGFQKKIVVEERKINISYSYYYPVGPIIQTDSWSKQNEVECIPWLENQPQKSVLFISFGSGGTISHDQLNEIAFGLEQSGQKFLWVVRIPNDISSSGYFVGQKDDPLEYLPREFLQRVKGQGLVVPSWAPQVEVLRHKSVGGFLTHCGWSSVLESVVYGVPMIAWPLFAEQRMNAKILSDVLKVAVRPKSDSESGLVKREEVSRVINILMEGDESFRMRKRIQCFSVAAANAMTEHGSSTKALSSLALKWQSCKKS